MGLWARQLFLSKENPTTFEYLPKNNTGCLLHGLHITTAKVLCICLAMCFPVHVHTTNHRVAYAKIDAAFACLESSDCSWTQQT